MAGVWYIICATDQMMMGGGGVSNTLLDTMAICQSGCWNIRKSHGLSHLNMAYVLCIMAIPHQLNDVNNWLKAGKDIIWTERGGGEMRVKSHSS